MDGPPAKVRKTMPITLEVKEIHNSLRELDVCHIPNYIYIQADNAQPAAALEEVHFHNMASQQGSSEQVSCTV